MSPVSASSPGLGDVRLGKDADEPAVLLDDRQATNLVLGHQPGGLVDGLLRIDGDDVLGCDVADGRIRAAALRDDADREIPVGDHADELVALDDRK